MENINLENNIEVLEFVKDNINKSLFIYSNMNLEGSIVRFKKHKGKIVGMYVIVFDKYITFLFEGNLEKRYILEIIEDSLNYKYSEGTVVDINTNILKCYYKIRNEDEKTHMATLSLFKNNKYNRYDNITLLDIKDKREVEQYLEAVATIKEFELVTVNTLEKNSFNSKIYVYKINNVIVGAATLSSISDYTGVVTGVFVLQEFRRQKIAYKMVSHLLCDNSDKDRNISIFFNNPYAQILYLKLGFEIRNEMSMFLR